MNAAWPEHRIKLLLDGTFTRLRDDGQTHTAIVELDFIPSHNGKDAPRRRVYQQRPWTSDEDVALQDLRAKGTPRHKIAELLGRSEETIRRRIARSKRMARHAALR